MPDQKHSSEKLPLVQHLIELRRSLLRSVIAIALFFLILFPFADEIYNFIAAPIVQAIPGSNLIAIGVISPFLTPLKMSLILAIYVAMPYLLYQLWMFVAPALYRHEKRLILPLVISSTLLFYVGLIFSFYIVFPVIFDFLAGVGPESVNFAPDIQYYLDFILKVSFAFGVAFEVPVVTILLIIFGVTTPQKLKKNRSYIIIGSFVLGMILTPPDVISQFLIAIPIWLLFEAGLIFSSFFRVRDNNKIKNSNSEKSDNDWTSKSHNEMMDKIEDEMNENGVGKKESDK
jgi:sec-independent protein translocase protein TatC